MSEIDKRDLNPTPEARMAMALWNHEYAALAIGCSQFFDGLTDGQKRTCENRVSEILAAAKNHRRIKWPTRKVPRRCE